MDWMRKTVLRHRLLFLLVLGALGNASQGSVRSGIGHLLPHAQQEKAGQAEPGPDAPAQSAPSEEKLSLSDQVIQDVLEPLKTGMETQNIQQVLSVFDKRELNSYANLQGQLRAFFQQFDEVHFRYQILQVTADKDHGSATAEMEMDALPYEVTTMPVRRSVQMHLQMKLEPKGWKVISFSPADFFGMGFNRADAQ
jgi:hypothetical protein